MFPERKIVVYALIAILPVSAIAEDARATLRSEPGVLVNGNSVEPVWTIFQHDYIKTPKAGVATIELPGSKAIIRPDTIVSYEGDELLLEHGTVSVDTSTLLRVRVGCITVTPVRGGPTSYDVTDVDGKVKISALKDDVYVDARSRDTKDVSKPSKSERAIVRETEQKTREDKCAAAPLDHADAKGAFLDSPYAIAAGAIMVGGVTWWVLCQNSQPASPQTPKSSCFP